jgi:hypothetical protein
MWENLGKSIGKNVSMSFSDREKKGGETDDKHIGCSLTFSCTKTQKNASDMVTT